MRQTLVGIGSGQQFSTSAFRTAPRDDGFPIPPYLIANTAIAAFAGSESAVNEFIGFLDQVTDDMCATTCEDMDYFDCDCRNAFDVYNSGKDECSVVVCDVLQTFRGKWMNVLQKMTEANSYQEMVVAALPLAEKLKNKICNCKDDLAVAIQGCMTGRTKMTYGITNELKRVRWGLVRRIWANLMGAVCNQDCELADTFHLVKLGKILDESSSGTGSCFDFRDTTNEIVRIFSDAPEYGRLVDAIWCSNRKCRKELEKKFNTCCYGHLVDVFSDKMRGNLVKIMASIADYSDDEYVGVRWTVDSIADALDPEKSSCSGSTRDLTNLGGTCGRFLRSVLVPELQSKQNAWGVRGDLRNRPWERLSLVGIGSGQQFSTSAFRTAPRDDGFPIPPYLIANTAIAAFAGSESAVNEFIGFLDQVTDDMCATTCEDMDYFDCDCRNAFDVYNSGKDECSAVVCDVLQTFRGKWMNVLQKMTEANSYQEMVVAALPLAEKLKNKICNCKDDLAVAIQGCMTGRTKMTYGITNELKRVRWGLVRRIWANLMGAVCNQDCELADTFHLVKLGKILDESSSGTGSCFDFRDTTNEIVRIFSDAPEYGRLVDAIWCSNRKCRKELEKKFNTCCYGHLVDVFSDKMRGNLVKIMASIADYSDDEYVGVRWTVDSIADALDPEKSSCSGSTRDCEELYILFCCIQIPQIDLFSHSRCLFNFVLSMILLLVLSVALVGIGSGQQFSTSTFRTAPRNDDFRISGDVPQPKILYQAKDEVCATSCEYRDYYDCDCRNAFDVYNSGKDECSAVVCDVLQTFRGKWMKQEVFYCLRLRMVLMVVAALPLAEKLKNKICNCKDDLAVAIQGCMTGRTKMTYGITNELKRVRWGLVRRIWANLMGAVCLVLTLNRLWKVNHFNPLILDESSSGTGSCFDFRDTTNEIVRIFSDAPEYGADHLRYILFCCIQIPQIDLFSHSRCLFNFVLSMILLLVLSVALVGIGSGQQFSTSTFRTAPRNDDFRISGDVPQFGVIKSNIAAFLERQIYPNYNSDQKYCTRRRMRCVLHLVNTGTIMTVIAGMRLMSTTQGKMSALLLYAMFFKPSVGNG
eukprot:sb/3461408/